jgi:hypothetical protein
MEWVLINISRKVVLINNLNNTTSNLFENMLSSLADDPLCPADGEPYTGVLLLVAYCHRNQGHANQF